MNGEEAKADVRPVVENGVRNAKTCPKIATLMSEASATTTTTPSVSTAFPMTAAEESLHNLSAAITQRQQSENGPGTNYIKIGLPGKLILSKRKGLREVLFS